MSTWKLPPLITPIDDCGECLKMKKIVEQLASQAEQQIKREKALIMENNALKLKLANLEKEPIFKSSMNCEKANAEDDAPYIPNPTVFRLSEEQEKERRQLLDFTETEIGKRAYTDYRQNKIGRSVKLVGPPPPKKKKQISNAKNLKFIGSKDANEWCKALI